MLLQSLTWRTRTYVVAVIYAVWVVLAITGLALAANDHVHAALALAITVPVVHFANAAAGMLLGMRIALAATTRSLAIVGDWMQAFALGLACAVVSRGSVDDEMQVAIASNLLVGIAQLGCLAKTYQFLSSELYDQTTGDFLGDE